MKLASIHAASISSIPSARSRVVTVSGGAPLPLAGEASSEERDVGDAGDGGERGRDGEHDEERVRRAHRIRRVVEDEEAAGGVVEISLLVVVAWNKRLQLMVFSALHLLSKLNERKHSKACGAS